jgi:hypothetical protein
VRVGVAVRVNVAVRVKVKVGVRVAVTVNVTVLVEVHEAVNVKTGLDVIVEVIVGLAVLVAVNEGVAVLVAVNVALGTGLGTLDCVAVGVIVGVPGTQSYHLTQSTRICCGKTVVTSGLPGHVPPTATLRIMKKSWFSSARSAGVMSMTWYCAPSKYNLMAVASHSIPNM